MSSAYLNGEFVPLNQAKVPVLDRGFLFADGVYEVIPVYAGKMFRLHEHLQRLHKSLSAIQLPLDHYTAAKWRDIFQRLVDDNEILNATIYVQVTRGVYAERSHDYPDTVTPTVLAMISPLPGLDYHSQTSEIKGISAITVDDIRWQRCDIKATTLLANCMMKQQALESGADDSILVRDGLAGEATASNLLMVVDGVLVTPPDSEHILPGITRDFVLGLAREHGIPVIQRDIKVAELAKADEIWLTSSTKEIRPVVKLNGAIIGNGEIGPVWQQMNQWFQKLKKRLFAGEIVEL